MRRAEVALLCVCAVSMALSAAAQSPWDPVVGDTATVANGFGDVANEGAGAMAVCMWW